MGLRASVLIPYLEVIFILLTRSSTELKFYKCVLFKGTFLFCCVCVYFFASLEQVPNGMKFVPKVSYSTFQEMNNSLQQEQGNQSATELGGKTRTRSSNKQHSLLTVF